MAVVTYKQIHPANAYLVRSIVEAYNPATNAYQPLTGATLTASFATNSDGTGGLTGLQNLPMTESAGAAGTYYAVVQSATLAPLNALAGSTIYQIVAGGPYNAVRVVTALKVTVPRWAQ